MTENKNIYTEHIKSITPQRFYIELGRRERLNNLNLQKLIDQATMYFLLPGIFKGDSDVIYNTKKNLGNKIKDKFIRKEYFDTLKSQYKQNKINSSLQSNN